MRLAVRVQPRARTNALAGVVGGALKVRLTAPPIEGAANAALIAFLAERLDVPRSALRVISGLHGREKVVGIGGVPAETVRLSLGLS